MLLVVFLKAVPQKMGRSRAFTSCEKRIYRNMSPVCSDTRPVVCQADFILHIVMATTKSKYSAHCSAISSEERVVSSLMEVVLHDIS